MYGYQAIVTMVTRVDGCYGNYLSMLILGLALYSK